MDVCNVLVIDDDPNIRNLLTELLAGRQDILLFVAGSGPEAVKHFAANRVDVVLTDIHMPGFTGLELMADMKKINFKPEILVMTANATPESVETSRKLGARSVILKPFDDLEVIESEINKAMAAARAARGAGHAPGAVQPSAAPSAAAKPAPPVSEPLPDFDAWNGELTGNDTPVVPPSPGAARPAPAPIAVAPATAATLRPAPKPPAVQSPEAPASPAPPPQAAPLRPASGQGLRAVPKPAAAARAGQAPHLVEAPHPPDIPPRAPAATPAPAPRAPAVAPAPAPHAPAAARASAPPQAHAAPAPASHPAGAVSHVAEENHQPARVPAAADPPHHEETVPDIPPALESIFRTAARFDTGKLRMQVPIVCLQTWEEKGATAALRRLATSLQREFCVWSVGKGLVKENGQSMGDIYREPGRALEFIRRHKGNGLYVFADFRSCLEDKAVVRLLREMVMDLETARSMLVLMAPRLPAPPELQPVCAAFDWPAGGPVDPLALYEEVAEDVAAATGLGLDLPGADREALLQLIKDMPAGRARFEIARALMARAR